MHPIEVSCFHCSVWDLAGSVLRVKVFTGFYGPGLIRGLGVEVEASLPDSSCLPTPTRLSL